MPIAERLRKTRACVDVAKTELTDLHDFLTSRHITRVNEARAISEMKRRLTTMSGRLEYMIRRFDKLGGL